MSVISDLIEKVNDPDLRARLSEEVARMQKQKKFGLVFEVSLQRIKPATICCPKTMNPNKKTNKDEDVSVDQSLVIWLSLSRMTNDSY